MPTLIGGGLRGGGWPDAVGIRGASGSASSNIGTSAAIGPCGVRMVPFRVTHLQEDH